MLRAGRGALKAFSRSGALQNGRLFASQPEKGEHDIFLSQLPIQALAIKFQKIFITHLSRVLFFPNTFTSFSFYIRSCRHKLWRVSPAHRSSSPSKTS